jgi:ribonuclease J
VIAKDQAADFARNGSGCGGCGVGHGSSMVRLATRTHPLLTLTRDDTVIFSSRIIPGNDRPVFAMIADFLRQGVTVKSWITDPTVHTSGHAHRDEQKKMIELTRPRAFIPVHGTRHHLERHAELARSLGVSEVMVIENGDVAKLGGGLGPGGRVGVGRVATWEGGEIGESVLRDRRLLARGGALSVGLALGAQGRLAARPEVQARGVVLGDDEASTRFVALEVAKALDNSLNVRDDETIAEIRKARRPPRRRSANRP